MVENEDIFFSICFGILVGFILGVVIFGITTQKQIPSQDTLNDICRNLINDSNSSLVITGKVEEGKLICERPSYDNTLNIIIKNTGEEK